MNEHKKESLTEADLEILTRLREKEAGWISWEEFASLATGKDSKEPLARLRQAGYEFEEHPSYGLRLIEVPERLIAEEISFRLETEVIGRRIITLGEIPSTMDVARGLASQGGEEGLVVFAEFQGAGRGRLGRRWVSLPHKDLLFSVILRPGAPRAAGPVKGSASNGAGDHLLTITAAVAVARCIREAEGLQGLIRWPNDVIIKEKKVAGMMVEGSFGAQGLARLRRGARGAQGPSGDYGNFYILGVGINVNTPEQETPERLKATSTTLRVEKGAALDRTLLARKMLKYLDHWYLISQANEVEEIARAWRDLSSILGKRVKLLEEGKEFAGRVLDLSPEMGIMLELDSGAQRLFQSQRVTLLESTRL